MDALEAKKKLGLLPEDDLSAVAEAMDDKLFQFKKEILPLLVVPTLVEKRKNQLTPWVEIEGVSEEVHEVISFSEMENSPDAIAFLIHYEKERSQVQLAIMNAPSFNHLSGYLDRAISLQNLYMRMFQRFFDHFATALPEEAKSREMIDTGTLITALKSDQLSPSITWEIERELARIRKLTPLK